MENHLPIDKKNKRWISGGGGGWECYESYSNGDIDGFLLHVVLHVGALDDDPSAAGARGGGLPLLGAGFGRRSPGIALPGLLGAHRPQERGRQLARINQSMKTNLLFLGNVKRKLRSTAVKEKQEKARRITAFSLH